MKRIFQQVMILSAMLVMVCSCWKDNDAADSIFKIDLDKTQASMPVGGTAQLRATVYPESVKNKTIRWLSDDESIAIVDANGLIRGVAPGLTVIRISDASGKIYPATCAISVYTAPVSVTGVSITKSETTISVNGYETLNHTVAPQKATNKNVTWSSNNSSVATVDVNGKVTGIAAGVATITLTSEDGGFTSSCVVTVTNEVIRVTGVSFDKPDFIVSVNGTEQLSPIIAPSNATNKNVTWKSNAIDFATVSAEGVVTGIAAGTATISATTKDGGFTASCIVTIQEAAIPVTGLSLNKTVLTVSVNGTEQLAASIAPTNATNKNVTWSSNAIDIATVSAEGVITGIATGSATITATSEEGGFASSCVVTVQEAAIPVTGVSLNNTVLTVVVNGTEQLAASIAPANATNKNVTWSSNAINVATVSAEGLVSGISAGTATVTATSEDGVFTANCVITVKEAEVPVTGVSLNKTALSIVVNGTEQLSATIAPANATNKNVTWSSSATNVATVNAEGLITGIAAGTATVTATSEDGVSTANCVITVQEAVIPVTGVSLNNTALTVSVNGTGQLAATVAPANATNKNVTLSSNAVNVATVNAEGLITGISAGTATVTATSEDGGFTASCVVTVQEATVPVTGIALDNAALTVVVNETRQLLATVAPSNATNKNVTWSSNAVNVATVSPEGLITGIAAGTATVTATSGDGGFTASCVITVDIPVTGVSLDKTAIDMYIGDEEQLLATIVPNNAANTNATWSSSSTAVVTVGNDGVVTGISAGTATVTVTSADGGFTATCTVTVKNEMGDVAATGWSVPSSKNYEYSMTYVAQVAFRGTLSRDVNTEVAAFVGNELRGYAKLVHEPKLNVYLIHLIIYSNSASNETVVLKVYNPTKQRIYENCKEFTFHGDTSLGTASEILNSMP